MQIQTLIPLWRASLESDHAPRTVRSYLDHLKVFHRQLGCESTIDAITPQSIEAFKRARSQRCEPKTVALALTAVRSFCRWLIAAELRSDDPTLKVRFPKIPKSLPRALSAEQVRQLLAALAQPADLLPEAAFQWRRNRLAIVLMLYAGLRISEVRKLRWRDVLLDGRKLVIRAAKGDKDRVVPIHEIPLGELRLAASGRRESDAVVGHGDGAQLAEKSLHHVFERWVPRELKLAFYFTPHQLRHTFITTLIDRGANIFEAQELAGHESPETTRIYYRLSAEHLRGAIDRLPAIW
jgi:integrase/recombinase XerD